MLPCCSECSVTAFEPEICNCFFQYVMCLVAEGSYPQGLAVTYFQALAQEVSIVQLKSSRQSRADVKLPPPVWMGSLVFQVLAYFQRYSLSEKYSHYSEKRFFLGYHSWFTTSFWINRISSVVKK